MLFQVLRNKVFWFLDKLKGGKVRGYLDEIARINNNLESKEIIEYRGGLLRDLLQHASKTTVFYKRFSDFSKLEDFPVINKITVKDNFEDFKSDAFVDKPKFKVSTSGSTGFPFVLYQNMEKRIRNTADNLFFLKNAGYDIGERFYFLEAWRGVSMNNPVLSRIKNLEYIDISRFNDEAIEAFLRKIEKDVSVKSIMGLPSAFEAIGKYLDKKEAQSYKFKNVRAIIAVSEYLNVYEQKTMETYFNAPVFSRYSNEEMGIMAQQLPNSNTTQEFTINWASYYIEILKMDSDEKANAGELGRLVVTDLFNYAMPLIRYDTGDVASFSSGNTHNNSFPKLNRIEGRKMDFVYNTEGEMISPHLINTIFYNYFGFIKQYQFIQVKEKEYVVKLNLESDFFEHEKELIEAIKNEFGKAAKVAIVYVDEIPLLSSGKRKKVVNMS